MSLKSITSKLNKIKSRRGFSMAEVLAVVAIMAILAALTTPNLITIQRNYRQKELDAKAETIYLAVQNELVAAYNELRDELAQEKWQKNYVDLNAEQQDAIREIYSQRISEAEPKKYGEKK